MELGCGSFVEIECPRFFFFSFLFNVNGRLFTYSMPGPNLFLFYAPNSEWIKSPQVGFEPAISQLTADRSTTELLRNNRRLDLIKFNSRSQPMANMSSKFPFQLQDLLRSGSVPCLISSGTSKWLYFIIFHPYPNSIHLIYFWCHSHNRCHF